MADKTIGDLTQAESIGSEDLFLLEQNGEAKKLQGSKLIDYVTMNVISITVETLPAGSQATATYNRTTGTLSLGIPQGEQGNIGPANTLTIGTVTSGVEASATITGDAPNQVLNLVLKQGDKGNPGDDAPTITNIAIRQSDYHMIVTLSDGTSYDAGYCRGASGAGTGDMLVSIYDPQNKAQDIFAYIDNAVSGKQDKITANGILKGDGNGGVTAVTTTYVTSSLTVSNWSDRVYSFESNYPNSEYDITISVAPIATSTEYDAFANAKICGSADSNSVTAIGTVPTIDIPIIIKAVSK